MKNMPTLLCAAALLATVPTIAMQKEVQNKFSPLEKVISAYKIWQLATSNDLTLRDLTLKKTNSSKILTYQSDYTPCPSFFKLVLPDTFEYPLCLTKAECSSIFSSNVKASSSSFSFKPGTDPSYIWYIIFFLECYKTNYEESALKIAESLIINEKKESIGPLFTAYKLAQTLGILPLVNVLEDKLNGRLPQELQIKDFAQMICHKLSSPLTIELDPQITCSQIKHLHMSNKKDFCIITYKCSSLGKDIETVTLYDATVKKVIGNLCASSEPTRSITFSNDDTYCAILTESFIKIFKKGQSCIKQDERGKLVTFCHHSTINLAYDIKHPVLDVTFAKESLLVKTKELCYEYDLKKN